VKLLRHVVLRFVFAALVIVIATNPRLFAQPRTVSLCIVDTRPDQVGPYDPPAGPFAIGMYQQFVGRRLKDNSELNITVFPASQQRDILPEVHRLNCSWVLQLRYYRYADDDVFGQNQPRGARFDSLLFTLWNGATRKVIESGRGFVSLREPPLTPYASFRKQVLKTLNQLR
jgi:hypothetical protein